jgi:hypothetical protein
MVGREHPHKPSRKRLRQPPRVELRIPKNTFDREAWLAHYVERVVEREVHRLADHPPQEDAHPEPVSRNEAADLPKAAPRAD